ncbi:TonB-dependent receptor [Polaribacter pacificus]|uniref:TonB-dependent receptor n=2 Tax=Polaribacter pacificus TaxID=1775173 RepID=A0A917HWP2_9FLAO|nr:TonB-dependent receptor [Polaribacter pacificus]
MVSLQNQTTKTDPKGVFILQELPTGNQVLYLQYDGYQAQQFSLLFTGSPIDLGTLRLQKKMEEQTNSNIISLTDDELDEDIGSADNIVGLLQASKDLFLRTAAFEFSSSFFRIRGLDSEYGTVLINGVPMNKVSHGRPEWSNWGGLNEVLRNQEFSAGLSASNSGFGGFLGSTQINVRASALRPGGAVSYALSNRSYVHRTMATYVTGLIKKGWAFAFSASKRIAKEGYSDGTMYDANAVFIGIEKQINPKHSINITGIFTPVKRGKSSPNTEEVFNLKGLKYNAYWGFQKGKIRNSRIKEIAEPIVMLNHYWNLSSSSTLQTNLSYQFGKQTNSRIDFSGSQIEGSYLVSLGGSNPDPSYYQKLPSYALRQGLPNVYDIEKTFIKDGQLDWSRLYLANAKPQNKGLAAYLLYDDRSDTNQWTYNSIYELALNPKSSVQANVLYTKSTSAYYAKVLDLFGATGFLDVDSYAAYPLQQNNLLEPNRIVSEGDDFKYKYQLNTSILSAFAQFKYHTLKTDFFATSQFGQTQYQRIGQYQNAKFPDSSFGPSKISSFSSYGFKFGALHKLTGRHLLQLNFGHMGRAPKLNTVFTNPRVHQELVPNLSLETITSADLSYKLRNPRIQASITGFFTAIRNATEVSFYYADGISGSGRGDAAFVQEQLTEIDKNHSGLEFALETQLTSSLSLKAVASLAQYIYNNNPTLSLKSEDAAFEFSSRPAFLKNYRLASGPQQAYSLGFSYNDPAYWWIGATVNYFDKIFIDVAPLTRTNNFANDSGIPFNDYDPELAKILLNQEQFDPYLTVNLIGGASWKLKNKYLSLFVSVNNLFNTIYKTGGFEQSRSANFRSLRDDKALDIPVFGAKYWYGRGASYFINLNFRF